MTWLSIAGVLITLAAVLAYLNHRLLKLPPTIAMTALSLLVSLALAGASWLAS